MYQRLLVFILTIIPNYSIKAQNSLKANKEIRYCVTSIIDTVTNRLATDTCHLRLNPDVSLFFNQGDFKLDSLRHNDFSKWTEMMSNSLSKKIRNGEGNFTCIVQKDFKQKRYTFEDRISADRFRYVDSIPTYKWEIIKEFKLIAGRKCQKAIMTYMGRNYVAWFEINSNLHDGPWKLCGLPGLILEAYDLKRNYVFTYIDEYPTDTEMSLPTSKHYNIDKSTFLKQQTEFYKDPISYMEQNSTIKIKFGNSQNPMRDELSNNYRHKPLEITTK